MNPPLHGCEKQGNGVLNLDEYESHISLGGCRGAAWAEGETKISSLRWQHVLGNWPAAPFRR